jgi:hypothetical protein
MRYPLTERGMVSAVNGDGTMDVTVSGRAHPYAGLQVMSGSGGVNAGDMVDVGFIDRHLHGRRWMPFVLGSNSACMGSGISSGGGPMVLSWHIGYSGTPNYTRSKYVLDTGYKIWVEDTSWTIPGPWDYIIGYTVYAVGYILTVKGADVKCYLASTGEVAWTRTLLETGSHPTFNPYRNEVVFLRDYNNKTYVDIVIDASTGSAVGGSVSWDRINGSGLVVVYNDLIYDLGHTEDRDPAVFIRDGINGYRFLRNQTIDTSSGLGGGTSSYYIRGLVTADGIAPYYVLGSKMVAECERNHIYDGYQYSYAIGILDLSKGSSSITETVIGPPPRKYSIFGYYQKYYMEARIDRMAPDGISHGRVTGYFTIFPPDGDPYPRGEELLAVWDTSGARLATHGSLGWDTVPYTDYYRIDYPLSSRRASATGLMGEGNPQTCVVKDLSTKLWVKTGTSGQPVFSSYGGESSIGENQWILVRIDGAYKFMDPNNGDVLGDWDGNEPVMVSAGVIYDVDDDGNLRRWKA